MYLLYFIILVLAFILNIFIVTNSVHKDVGVAPVIQLVFIVPIFIISSAIFYFTKTSNLSTNYHILLPFLIEIIIFAFTKELFGIFKKDGFLTRFYILSIALATIIGYLLHYFFPKFF